MASALSINITGFISSHKILLLAVLLTIVAAVPRLYQLGDLGFYMDEETTAFASRSMAETGQPRMPSGMPYYRSLPHTWINSVSAKIFGLENEFSYRLPAALFGIFTIPLIFLLARPLTGTHVAFIAALLLALSEWHIITSRQARMYAPFLFFYVACSFSILRWAQKDMPWYLTISILLAIATATLHSLGVFIAFIPLIALFVKDYSTTKQYKLILFSAVSGVSAFLYGKIIAGGPYAEWKNAHGITSTSIESSHPLLQYLPATGMEFTLGAIGFLLGIWLAFTSGFDDRTNGKEFRILTRFALSVLVGIFAASGHLHGAFLSLLLLLLLYQKSLVNYLFKSWKPLLAITLLASITVSLTLIENGIIPGIKTLLMFPYPNWVTFYSLSPGITLLFLLAMLYLAGMNKTAPNTNIRILLIICLLPLILVSIFKKWAAARYLIQAYPFILILASYTLYVVSQKFFKSRHVISDIPAFIISCLIALSGVLGGHGLISAYKVATVEYGDRLNKTALIFPFYPDHKTPGDYVTIHRAGDDIVIAEDVIEQRWYAGEINYWLRKYNDNTGGSFTYIGKDHKLYDIYANSIVATSDILKTIENNKTQIIWLITSGETFYQRDLYLREEQRQWLEYIESTHIPVYTGKDNITKVYCLNCDAAIVVDDAMNVMDNNK